MATTRFQQNTKSPATRPAKSVEDPKEIAHDVVEYLTDYARAKPGYAALTCVGIGFVLGWKLKPW